MNEKDYDELLNIKTSEDPKKLHNSFHYHPYEPTGYKVLEALFNEYELKPNDRLVDFGCGKGRLNFLTHHLFELTSIGIEMNETFYQQARINKEKYFQKRKGNKEKIHFYCSLAEEYLINKEDNRFYFFNPFSIQIFRKVINNILISVEEKDRDIELILYYPSEDYIYFLEKDTTFELKKEISLYVSNPHERFLIYRLE